MPNYVTAQRYDHTRSEWVEETYLEPEVDQAAVAKAELAAALAAEQRQEEQRLALVAQQTAQQARIAALQAQLNEVAA